MEIVGLEWCCQSTSYPDASYLDLEIHMGLCSADQLVPTFEDNYLPGTKTLVMSADTLCFDVEPNQWVSVVLDQPYVYDGEQNLLIEVFHNPNYTGFNSWSWLAGESRSVGAYGNPGTTGSPDERVPWMVLVGASGLRATTFGGIKALFAR